MKRTLIAILLALALVVIPASSAFAKTTADVTVTATPTKVSIKNAPDAKAFGEVDVDTTYWAKTGEDGPGEWALVDGDCFFTITNKSTVAININIKGTDFTGETGWTLSADGTNGVTTAGMKAGASGCANEGAMTAVKKDAGTGLEMKHELAANTNIMWELKLLTPTQFTTGEFAERHNTVTLTAAAH
jgi:hypothetical protein